jgi:hypothetical protein
VPIRLLNPITGEVTFTAPLSVWITTVLSLLSEAGDAYGLPSSFLLVDETTTPFSSATVMV